MIEELFSVFKVRSFYRFFVFSIARFVFALSSSYFLFLILCSVFFIFYFIFIFKDDSLTNIVFVREITIVYI